MPLSPSTSAMPARSRTTRMFGLQVDAAGADAPHVLRQPDHAVAVRALQVRVRHQRCHDARIRVGHAERFEGSRDERPQRRGIEAAWRTFPHPFLLLRRSAHAARGDVSERLDASAII